MIANLRYALVHDWLTEPGGSEDVFRQICDLYPGVVFTSQWDRERVRFLKDYEVRTSFVQHLPYALQKHYLYAPLLPKVYRQFDLSEFDVVLSDSHSFAHGARAVNVVGRQGTKTSLHICYYHTPARSLWMPEIDDRATTGTLAPLKRVIAKRLKRLDLAASRGPHVLLANSLTTAARIRKFYSRQVERVIYPPVDTEKWADVRRESEDLGLLYWGRLIAYKRIDLVIEVARRTGEKLQIVGSGPQEKALKTQAEGMPNVTFHGRLADPELKSLVGRCRALIFPGHEDFGMVVVEAMAAGLPVICFGVGGAAESVGPEHGVRFGEQSPEAIVEALRVLDSRNFDPEATRAHAATFGVARFRREYREAVDHATDRWFTALP